MLALLILLSFIHLTVSYTVIPDDCSPNTTCPHCHNLKYFLQNSTKYFTHNTQLLFLPGLYHLQIDLIIENFHNISFLGSNHGYNNNTIIQCNSSVGIIMKNITNLSVENMVIRNCLARDSFSAAIIMKDCNDVKLHYMQIYHTHYRLTKREHCLLGHNIMGSSNLSHITCDKQLHFYYNEISSAFSDHVISLDHCKILGNFTNIYESAIFISLHQSSYSLTFHISNTNFKKFQKCLDVQAKCALKCNTMVITNCQFCGDHYKTEQSLLRLSDVNVYFNNCQFVNHDRTRDAIISIRHSEMIVFNQCIFHHNKNSFLLEVTYYSNITIEHCKFYENAASVFTYTYTGEFPGPNCEQIVNVTINNTTFFANKPLNLYSSLLKVRCARLLLNGPVKFISTTYNFDIGSISASIDVFKSTVTVYGYIEFSQNVLGSLIKYSGCEIQECFTMNVADNVTLMINKNKLGTYFTAELDSHYYHVSYPPCYFQYLNSSITNANINCSIIFNGNVIDFFSFLTVFQATKIKLSALDSPMQEIGPKLIHCYWLPHSKFTTTIPLDINEKYVEFTNNSESLNQIYIAKPLCYCIDDTHYDCYKDDLGYIYPGQTAYVPFCYPDNHTDINNAEVLVDTKINGTHFTPCVVHKPKEFIQFTSNKCTTLQYTIVFVTDNWCELFLKVLLNGHEEYNIFYVRQFHCPLGFIKKDGICQCYPLFRQFDITDCNINDQTILRPANSWIFAANHNDYYISLHCPFYYCVQHSFHLNLSTPELQCQFNRSGFLCGQCQNGLSTIFGSPICQYCSSVYLLLVIPIAIAGIVLVLLLFLLNLTVTAGTINAFILYVNIISINNTIFFPDFSQNTFEYVFISLANLDLGVNTCFYNGMDDYAKMWLQLAFPFYLIFIATILIITSRYSSRIQKVTAHRALPVLATLFLLSYTKLLRIVSIVLFFYSSITHLPSKHTTQVWSVDANIPLFGVQFTVLFTVCLILFLILVPFSFILLLTKIFSRFSIITKFKPLLDAYQGPYKIKFYYWTGLQLMLRTVFFGLSSLDSNINLKIGIVILIITNTVHTSSEPFKSKIKSYQESLFIINLLGLYTFTLSFTQNEVKKIFVNVLIIVAAVQFVFIVLYHIFKYACSEKIKERAISLLHVTIAKRMIRFCKRQAYDQQLELHQYNIPEVTYNYREYQEPLIGQEYCK